MCAQPGYESGHRVEVITIGVCIRPITDAARTIIILQTNADNRFLTSPQGTFRKHAAGKSERQVRTHPVPIGMEAYAYHVLSGGRVPIAPVVCETKAGLNKPFAQWVVNRPNSDADKEHPGSAAPVAFQAGCYPIRPRRGGRKSSYVVSCHRVLGDGT